MQREVRLYTAVLSSSQRPYLAVEYLKCGRCDWGTEFFILFNFKFKQPHVASGYHIAQCSSMVKSQSVFQQNEEILKSNKQWWRNKQNGISKETWNILCLVWPLIYLCLYHYPRLIIYVKMPLFCYSCIFQNILLKIH